MVYDIETSWELLDTCNYRCAYCFFPPERLGSKLRVRATPQQWASAFDGSGLRWLIHITGGEPSIYPDFAALCEKLTRNHIISLNSNLTGASLVEFAARVDPSRVHFINAGFHVEERSSRSGSDLFLRHAARLLEKGHAVYVSVVATPRALARMEETERLLAPLGLMPAPKLLRGVVDGRKFPAAYTDDEKRVFRRYAARARESYRGLIGRMGMRPSIDVFDDDRYLDSGVPVFRGEWCEAGSRFVEIHADGSVHRCGITRPLGNILDGTFRRLGGPERCDTTTCYYFCNKYAERASAAPQRDESAHFPAMLF